MRRVSAAGDVVNKERLVGSGRVQTAHIFDGVIRQVGREVVAGLADPRKHRCRITIEVRCPLVRFAAEEPIKILKAQADRPLVERPGSTVLKRGNVVIFAEPRRGVAVIAEDGTDGRVLRTDQRIVAWVAGGQFADYAIADRVMVAACDDRRARRRT